MRGEANSKYNTAWMSVLASTWTNQAWLRSYRTKGWNRCVIDHLINRKTSASKLNRLLILKITRIIKPQSRVKYVIEWFELTNTYLTFISNSVNCLFLVDSAIQFNCTNCRSCVVGASKSYRGASPLAPCWGEPCLKPTFSWGRPDPPSCGTGLPSHTHPPISIIPTNSVCKLITDDCKQAIELGLS